MTDLIEKIARVFCCGVGDCSCEVHWEPPCFAEDFQMEAKAVASIILREMMECATTRQGPSREAILSQFVKSFARSHSINLEETSNE